jgi:putative transposase
MPRAARIKSYDSIYHIMIRSNGRDLLFNDSEEFERYLSLIKKYQMIFKFKVYAFCLLDNHGHLIIDCNGADISKIMHGINQSYAQYHNRKNDRRGHVFQDRYKSIIVHDDSYLVTLTQYIHSNPKDVPGYTTKIEKYKYSSLGIYLGIAQDAFDILDVEFVNNIFNVKKYFTQDQYLDKTYKSEDEATKASVEFKNEKSQYRSEYCPIIRNRSPERVMDYVIEKTGIPKEHIGVKYQRTSTESKALCTFLMRSMCGLTYSQICSIVGNLSQTRVSKLTSIGLSIVCNDERYKSFVEDFLAC